MTSKKNDNKSAAQSGANHLNLEEIVHLTNKAGMEYAHAKKIADRHELLKPTIRAKVILRLDDGSFSEVKLKRLAETDGEYISFLESYAEAKAKCEHLKIRYESFKNLFEAKRSLLSYHKAEMNLF